MEFKPVQAYHVYNRGNKKHPIFFCKEDYMLFLEKIKLYLLPHCDILAYCLMPNHFHLILLARDASEQASGITGGGEINKGIGILLRSYPRAKQSDQRFTGSLFQQKTKAKALLSESGENQYLSICTHYIHQNPLKAGLVTDLFKWNFSS